MWSDSVVDPELWNGTAWLDSGPSLLGGLRDLHCLAESGTFTAWRNRDLDCLADSGTFTGTGTVEVERSRTILRAAGVVHQLTQASTRMGTFLGVSSTGVHLGTG